MYSGWGRGHKQIPHAAHGLPSSPMQPATTKHCAPITLPVTSSPHHQSMLDFLKWDTTDQQVAAGEGGGEKQEEK